MVREADADGMVDVGVPLVVVMVENILAGV